MHAPRVRGEGPAHRSAVDGTSLQVERLLVRTQILSWWRVPAQPAVEVEPGHPELAPGEVVDEKVGRRVEAHEQVGDPDDTGGDGVKLALLTRGSGLRRAPNQLVEIRDDLEALADDEEGAHCNQNDAEIMFFFLLPKKRSPREGGGFLDPDGAGGRVSVGGGGGSTVGVADAGDDGAAEGGGGGRGAEEARAGLDAAAEARVGCKEI